MLLASWPSENQRYQPASNNVGVVCILPHYLVVAGISVMGSSYTNNQYSKGQFACIFPLLANPPPAICIDLFMHLHILFAYSKYKCTQTADKI